MLGIVCRTYEGVKVLEKYDGDGMIISSAGIHGLGSSIGNSIKGRFQVICLEDLRQETHQLFSLKLPLLIKFLTVFCFQAICWWVCS